MLHGKKDRRGDWRAAGFASNLEHFGDVYFFILYEDVFNENILDVFSENILDSIDCYLFNSLIDYVTYRISLAKSRGSLKCLGLSKFYKRIWKPVETNERLLCERFYRKSGNVKVWLLTLKTVPLVIKWSQSEAQKSQAVQNRTDPSDITRSNLKVPKKPSSKFNKRNNARTEKSSGSLSPEARRVLQVLSAQF